MPVSPDIFSEITFPTEASEQPKGQVREASGDSRKCAGHPCIASNCL